MGWKEFFKIRKKDRTQEAKAPARDSAQPVVTFSLSDLKVGYLLDYDLKTWEVVARHHYDWGVGGNLTYEWELKSTNDMIYLEKNAGFAQESNDAAAWCVSRPIPFASLGARVRNYIQENEDPPDEIDFEGTLYHLDEFGGGKFFKNGQGSGREFLIWDYEDASGKRFLCIEQWEEDEFDASVGIFEGEDRFTNILPRAV